MVSFIKQSFETIKYGSYPQNADFDDLPIEYQQRLLTQQKIDGLIDNKLENLKVISIEKSLDNRRYKINNWNVNFDDLIFDCDEMLIRKRTIISYKWYNCI